MEWASLNPKQWETPCLLSVTASFSVDHIALIVTRFLCTLEPHRPSYAAVVITAGRCLQALTGNCWRGIILMTC